MFKMLSLWKFFPVILLIWFTLFERCTSVSSSPACLSGKYIEKRSETSTTQLREIAHLPVLRMDKKGDDIVHVTDNNVYQNLLRATGTTSSPEAEESFYQAMTDITQGFYKTCYGSHSESISISHFHALVSKYEKALVDRDTKNLREAFGALTCLKVKNTTSRLSRGKRETGAYSSIDDFFRCIDGTKLVQIFFKTTLDYSVAFVIDDTGSMRDEIRAAKCLVRSLLKSQGKGPARYILGTFNDPG